MPLPQVCHNPAPDGPGIAPRWTRGGKEAMSTAYSTSSRIWYTVSRGLVNEVYFPTIDRPQIRDLQYLVTDGETFLHDPRRDFEVAIESLSETCLGIRITGDAPDGLYRLVQEIISDPHEATLLIQTRLEAPAEQLARLKLYVLCAPHLEVGGRGNTGRMVTVADRKLLVAYKGRTCLALGATAPFKRCSCGYVGVNDGWTDLVDNYRMDWEYDGADDGNIALIAEIDLSQGPEFTLGLAFGQSFHNAAVTLFESLAFPYDQHKKRFLEQWSRLPRASDDFERVTGDGGHLHRKSHSLLVAHEDKTFSGAMIASASIPWGEVRGDQAELGGYHLVWTRDMVKSVTGLLTVNDYETPFRALMYLAVLQHDDGGFPQNFWLDGRTYWEGIQLDEVAFPILLAWRLHTLNALQQFDPYPLVCQAAGYLIRQGPATPQERWEEVSGYSPSTLASNIAALTCAALFARHRGDDHTADFIQAYADFLEAHVEQWTVTTQGELVPDIPRHYIRIKHADPDNPRPNENPNEGSFFIASRPPGEQAEFPNKNVVDGGFLELVRYGIRRAGDPLIEDSLRVVDAVLKVDTPHGPAWHRYNHDGYGQRPDGSAYQGWGRGRAWPLLTGERGHYELAAGRPVKPFINAMENFSTPFGLLPEQVWDEADKPEQHLYCGGLTGSATPLVWAHSEYLKLVHSAAQGQVFDFIPEVADRYLEQAQGQPLEVWKPNRQTTSIKAGRTLRIQAPTPFRLRWTDNEWQDVQETRSIGTGLGIEYVDIPTGRGQQAPIHFTFRWLETGQWEGQDYTVSPVEE